MRKQAGPFGNRGARRGAGQGYVSQPAYNQPKQTTNFNPVQGQMNSMSNGYQTNTNTNTNNLSYTTPPMSVNNGAQTPYQNPTQQRVNPANNTQYSNAGVQQPAQAPSQLYQNSVRDIGNITDFNKYSPSVIFANIDNARRQGKLTTEQAQNLKNQYNERYKAWRGIKTGNPAQQQGQGNNVPGTRVNFPNATTAAAPTPNQNPDTSQYYQSAVNLINGITDFNTYSPDSMQQRLALAQQKKNITAQQASQLLKLYKVKYNEYLTKARPQFYKLRNEQMEDGFTQRWPQDKYNAYIDNEVASGRLPQKYGDMLKREYGKPYMPDNGPQADYYRQLSDDIRSGKYTDFQTFTPENVAKDLQDRVSKGLLTKGHADALQKQWNAYYKENYNPNDPYGFEKAMTDSGIDVENSSLNNEENLAENSPEELQYQAKQIPERYMTMNRQATPFITGADQDPEFNWSQMVDTMDKDVRNMTREEYLHKLHDAYERGEIDPYHMYALRQSFDRDKKYGIDKKTTADVLKQHDDEIRTARMLQDGTVASEEYYQKWMDDAKRIDASIDAWYNYRPPVQKGKAPKPIQWNNTRNNTSRMAREEMLQEQPTREIAPTRTRAEVQRTVTPQPNLTPRQREIQRLQRGIYNAYRPLKGAIINSKLTPEENVVNAEKWLDRYGQLNGPMNKNLTGMQQNITRLRQLEQMSDDDYVAMSQQNNPRRPTNGKTPRSQRVDVSTLSPEEQELASIYRPKYKQIDPRLFHNWMNSKMGQQQIRNYYLQNDKPIPSIISNANGMVVNR